ncbi:unnamed protein product [Arabis nemorensis]|uniref:Uncharacterized protein n=1 Tax=Arabis nemorensis TaxID=586526 RepID=A0A565AZI1_9BRAS|nr:unnamed protein product [Arabis nemorensis]
MAEKTLSCSDSKEKSEISSPDFEFPSIKAMVALNSNTKELCEGTRRRQLPLCVGSPEATEFFAERMARMRKDPESIPILADIDDRGPGAAMEFWEDKDVLKKLAKAATLGAVESLNEDEQVSEGKKALNIACGYAQMKCLKILLDAGVYDAGGRRMRSTPRCAPKRGKKKSGLCKKGHAVASPNTESETPSDVATTSFRCTEAA